MTDLSPHYSKYKLQHKLKCKSNLDIFIKIKNLYILWKISHVEFLEKIVMQTGKNVYTKMLLYSIVFTDTTLVIT